MVRVELNQKGISSEVLFGLGVRGDLARRAAAVARAAGPGHLSEVQRGRDRWRAAAWTATSAARRRQANNNSLLSALDAART